MTNKFFITSVFFLIGIKVLSVFYTNFNLFADEAQYWLWSKNLDFGYFSKPPLLAWFLRIYTDVFGDSFEALKFFSMPFYVFTSCFVYLVCKKIGLEKSDSFTCAIIFFVIPAVSLSSFIISTDVVLLLFWSALMYFVLKIRANPKNIYFILLGFFFGLAFLAKYAAVYFLLCLFFFIYFDRKTRMAITQNPISFFYFVLVSFVLIFPNLFWNYSNGWVTLAHTADNANFKNYDFNILRGLVFLLIQALMLGPFLFIGFLLNIKNFKIDYQNIYLLSFSLPIMVIVFLESVLVRANANWAAPALLALLILFYRSIKKYKKSLININFFFNLILGFVLFFAIATNISSSAFDRIRGVGEFASEVLNISKENKLLVINDRMLFSSLSYELRDKKIEMLMPHNPKSPVTNHFQITSKLKENEDREFILIGSPENISYLSKKHRIKLLKIIDKKFISEKIKIYEVVF